MPTSHPFTLSVRDIVHKPGRMREVEETAPFGACLLYTSDAADE